ncbi:hypothetical protein [Ruegeria lacuscaerulensis]|uniref:hypothetical protein n=1 Tax=Ruegeria lacuscaerulensis TaxID=55218 RepID=UPI00147F2A58|nr:hypothetical protein [Ruegeria lacuscaerulensis]
MPDYPNPTEMMKKLANLYSVEENFEDPAEFNRRLASIALDAAGRSTKLSSEWAAETIAELKEVSSQAQSSTEYNEKLRAFVEKQTELTVKNMEAYSDVARQVQTATLELMMEYSNKMATEAKKANQSATQAARTSSKKDG